MRELKPCPFCGGRPYLERAKRTRIKGKATRIALVRCTQCNARTNFYDIADFGKTSHSATAEKWAVHDWNRRA